MRKISLLIILLTTAVLFCGCGIHDEEPIESSDEIPDVTESVEETEINDPVKELELNLYIDGKTNYMQALIDRFKVEHPEVKLNLTDYSELTAEDYKTKLESELMMGEGPDLLLLNNDGTGALDFMPNMIKMLQSNVFLDVNELGIDFTNCNQTVMKAGVYDNKQVMVPLNYSLGYLYTTKERLEEAGVKYEDGITLEDFSAAFPAFYENNPDKKAFLNYFTNNFLYRQNAMDLIDYQNNKMKDDADSISSMGKLCRAYDNLFPGIFDGSDNVIGYMAYRNAGNYGVGDSGIYSGGGLLFMSGRAFNGNYESLNMYNKLYTADIADGQEPVIFTLPTLSGEMPAPYVTYYISVNSNTDNKEAVKYFIETAIGIYVQYISTGAGIPVNNNVISHMKEFYLKKRL